VCFVLEFIGLAISHKLLLINSFSLSIRVSVCLDCDCQRGENGDYGEVVGATGNWELLCPFRWRHCLPLFFRNFLKRAA